MAAAKSAAAAAAIAFAADAALVPLILGVLVVMAAPFVAMSAAFAVLVIRIDLSVALLNQLRALCRIGLRGLLRGLLSIVCKLLCNALGNFFSENLPANVDGRHEDQASTRTAEKPED